MRSRYRISLGGVQLDTLDDNLLILDIGYTSPERSAQKNAVANLPGFSISNTRTNRSTVTVTFELHIYDTAERNAALQKVNAWASAGGTLKTSDREAQMLQDVFCENLADLESSRDWTKPLSLVFSTTTNPYWRSNTEKKRSMTGKSGSGTLVMDGNAETALVLVTATAETKLTAIQLKAGNTMLKLTGINVPAGKKLTVDYKDNRYLRILANGTSVISKLDKTSSDNLLAECGKSNSVSFTADAKSTVEFSARGCWL